MRWWICLDQRSSIMLCTTNFMCIWEMPSFLFLKYPQLSIHFLFVCVYLWSICVCSFLRSYGEKFIVSIDRTRKNRRGKISSLFLFAADLLIWDSSGIQHCYHTYNLYVNCSKGSSSQRDVPSLKKYFLR